MSAHNHKSGFALRFHELEQRDCPAITLQFDYTLDSSGFFNNAQARQTLQAAGNQLVSRLNSSLAPISPSGNNTWQAILNHPTTGAETKITNLTVPADTLIVYAGGMNNTGPEAGLGGPGGFWVRGSSTFQSNVAKRGQATFGPWGGSVSFDTGTNWYLGQDVQGKQPGQLDFYSVATHELGHLLGFGTSDSWFDSVNTGRFTGTNVTRLNGGQVALSADQAHFTQNTLSNGNAVSMRPIMDGNQRVLFSELDYAALADVGWSVSGISTGVSLTPATTISTTSEPGRSGAVTSAAVQPAAVTQPPLTVSADKISVVSNPSNGTVQLFTAQGGKLVATGTAFQPFIGFLGEVRGTAADVNGDGVGDLVLGTGPNGGSSIRILDGKTFKDVVPQFLAFESSYTGGVFVAAADLDRDGRAEIIVTPDQGGGGRVQITKVDNGATRVIADFFGIDDPNFRGGARATIGDINGDGTPDVVVAAGFGGGPRVAIYDGNGITTARRTLVPDFFAFESTLRNGVYLTIGDLDGNGSNELIFGAGPGGAPRVMAISASSLIKSGSAAAIAQPVSNGFVGDIDQRGGVRVSTKDLEGDGRRELITGSGSGNDVRVFKANGGSFSPSSVLTPFSTLSSTDGVFVG
jgi:hypothetical protein